MRTRRPVLGRDGDGGLGEHCVGEDRPADAPERLERQILRSVVPLETTEAGVDEGDDRVEVPAEIGPNIKMMANSPAAVAAAFSKS